MQGAPLCAAKCRTALRGPRRAAPESGNKTAQPGQHAQDQDGKEVPPRTGTFEFAGEKSGELLIDEKVVEKLGITRLHPDEPGRGNGQKNEQTAEDIKPRPQLPVAVNQGVEHQRGAGQQNADQSLGQHGKRHEGPGGPHPPTGLGATGAWPLRQQKGHQTRGHGGCGAHVQRVDVAHRVPVKHARQHACGKHPGAPVEQPCSGPAGEQHREQAGEPCPQTRLPFAEAEHFISHRSRPVLQRRFFEVFETVEPGRDPVARHHHFPRNFGVAAFVRRNQIAPAQRAQPENDEGGKQQPGQAAAGAGV